MKTWKRKSKQHWQTHLTTLSKTIAVLALCFAANVHADGFRHYSDWTTEEKAWFTGHAALSYVDYKQTMWMVKQKTPDGLWMYEESNPMFPKRVRSHQIGTAKLIGLALNYWVIGKYSFNHKPTKYATMANAIGLGIVVVNNHNIGISVSVTF